MEKSRVSRIQTIGVSHKTKSSSVNLIVQPMSGWKLDKRSLYVTLIRQERFKDTGDQNKPKEKVTVVNPTVESVFGRKIGLGSGRKCLLAIR